mmetsp:Transcript_114949/g.325591  ORF Transcript_114949/g.325591 Transcript_114949/m.325591 type:complete len:306 (-) Transcript_114949:1327-2244(-)
MVCIISNRSSRCSESTMLGFSSGCTGTFRLMGVTSISSSPSSPASRRTNGSHFGSHFVFADCFSGGFSSKLYVMHAGWWFWRLAHRFRSLKTTSIESYGSQVTRFFAASSSWSGAVGCSTRFLYISSAASTFELRALFCATLRLAFGIRPTVGRLFTSDQSIFTSCTWPDCGGPSSPWGTAACASSAASPPSSSAESAELLSATAAGGLSASSLPSGAWRTSSMSLKKSWRPLPSTTGFSWRFGRWYICRLHGSQNVTQPSSFVITHTCSTSMSCWSLPFFAHTVPLQMYASFLHPSSREQRSTA